MRIGPLQREVLTVVRRMGGSGYGMSIRCGVIADTGRTPAVASIYTCLEGLARRGWVCSGQFEGQRRFYWITAKGCEALAQRT